MVQIQIYGIFTPTFVIDASKEFRCSHMWSAWNFMHDCLQCPHRNPGEICEKKLRSYDNLLLHTWPKDQGLALTLDLLFMVAMIGSLQKRKMILQFLLDNRLGGGFKDGLFNPYLRKSLSLTSMFFTWDWNDQRDRDCSSISRSENSKAESLRIRKKKHS